MFKKVLVGVDRHGGGDAIVLAKQLLDQGGELTLVHVYSGDTRIWHASPTKHDLLARARSLDLLETASQEAGVEATLRSRASASVGRGLHELCELIGADLLVVGSSRRGLLGHVLIGDDTHAALNRAPCAIAIPPAGYARQPAPIHKIGIAYNASPESEHALAVARTIATEHEARLSALEVASLPYPALMAGSVPLGDTLEKVVDDAHAQIAAVGDVEPHAEYGIAAERLPAYSASVDLLIVGSRGHGPLGRLVHGSTSGRLARTARCPLLVLTRGAAASATSDLSQADLELAAAAHNDR